MTLRLRLVVGPIELGDRPALMDRQRAATLTDEHVISKNKD